MTDEPLDLDALERLCEEATPGPWNPNRATMVVTQADIAFIAAARTALPALIARVRELERIESAAKLWLGADEAFANGETDRWPAFFLDGLREALIAANNEREAT